MADFAAQGGPLSATVTALAVVQVIDVEGYSRVWLAFTVAAAALSAFQVEARGRPGGLASVIAAAAGDYTDPIGPVIGASDDLTTAGVGAHFLMLDVRAYKEITIKAAGTASVLAGDWSATP